MLGSTKNNEVKNVDFKDDIIIFCTLVKDLSLGSTNNIKVKKDDL